MELTLKQAVDMIGELKDEVTKLSGHVDRLMYENCKLRKENGVLRDKLISLGDTTISIEKAEYKHSSISTNKCKIIKKLYADGKIVAYMMLYPDNTVTQISATKLKAKMAKGEINVANATLTVNNRIFVRR